MRWVCSRRAATVNCNSRRCVSDPLARFARVSPSLGRAAEGGRGSLTRHLELELSNTAFSRGYSLPPLRG
jgi:hypothetical protein